MEALQTSCELRTNMFSFHFSTLTRLQRILEIQQLRRWEEAYVYRIA